MSDHTKSVYVKCDCGCCVLEVSRHDWGEGDVDYNVCVLDSRYDHKADGVWRSAELHVCGAGLDGRHFFENTWFHDGLLERLQDRYPDCLAFVVDFHS